jgi:hypothetical protein
MCLWPTPLPTLLAALYASYENSNFTYVSVLIVLRVDDRRKRKSSYEKDASTRLRLGTYELPRQTT